jgi:hypothetical protein
MKVRAIKVEGLPPHCDEVYYKDNDASWEEIDDEIMLALQDILDVGDSLKIKVSVVEVEKEWLDNLTPADEL